MDTHSLGGRSERANLRPRSIFIPLLALALSALLLAAWLRVVSAQNTSYDAPLSSLNGSNQPLVNPYQSLSILPGKVEEAARGPALAPLAVYDLSIQKTQSPQFFTIGGTNTYIINVLRSNTEMVPSGFSVEDTLPAGMTWTHTSPIGNWDCSASTVQKVSCYYTQSLTGTMLIDPIQFNVNVAGSVADVVYNTAYLYFGTSTKSSTILTPIRIADLALNKKRSPDLVLAGGTLISYTLTITNNGPWVASNAIVTETLPTYLENFTTTNLISGTNPTKGSFDVNTRIWTIGNMAQNESQTLILLARLLSSANSKTITNQARASSNIQDLNQTNNLASTSFFVGGLEISKDLDIDLDPANPDLSTGDVFSFTINIKNASSSAINNALVRDVFSNTLDIVNCKIFYSPTNIQNCYVSDPINPTLNTYLSTLSGNTTTSVVIQARGNQKIGNNAFTFKNRATVTWGSPSSTIESNEVEGTIYPGGSILVNKDDRLSNVERSQLISYTITITNIGSLATSSSNPIVVTDTFINNIEYYSIDKKGLTINEDIITANSRSWKIQSSLSPGQVISFIIWAKVPANPIGSETTNIIEVSAKDITNRIIRAIDSDTNNIPPSTEFIINKDVYPDSALAGETFYFTINIKNVSGSTKYPTIYDTFSSYLDILSCEILFESPTKSPSFCFVTNRNLSTSISLDDQQSAKVRIGARGNKEIGSIIRQIPNTASISWGAPVKTRNSNEVDITIFPRGFLSVGKSNGVDYVYRGEEIAYTISISNVGSLATTANTLRVTDTFLSNVGYVSIDPGGLTMEQVYSSGNVRAWVIKNKSLSPGEKISFSIGAKVSSSPSSATASNRISATARDVASSELLPLVSATDYDEISETPYTTLLFLKSVSPQLAQVGETFTFKIEIQNNGSTTLKNLVMSDYFPKELDLTSATTSRGTAQLSTSTREVEVTIPTLNGGEKATVVVLAKVNSTVTAPKTLHNRASMNWTGGGSAVSNSIAFRVLTSGSLPGTGPVGESDQAGWIGATQIFAALGLLLVGFGLAVLFYWLYARQRRPLYAGRYARGGLALLAVAMLCGLAAWFARPKIDSLSMLGGQKPPLASSAPATQSPTAAYTTTETEPAPLEATPEAQTTEFPELRPTRDPLLPTEDPTRPTPTLTAGEVDISYLLPTPTPLDLPEYSVPTPEAIPQSGPLNSAPDSSAVTRLVIPKMGLDAIVRYVPFSGSTWLISGLKQEIAWMGDTSWPGLGSNTGLAGHVDLVTGAKGPFWNLKELKSGEDVILYTEKNVYTYRVRQQTVVDDHDLSVIHPTDNPQVTLITCTSWDSALRAYVRRLVVYADLVNVKPRATQSN